MISTADLRDWTKAEAADDAVLRRLEVAAVAYCQNVTGKYLGVRAEVTDSIRFHGWPLQLANDPIGATITAFQEWDGSAWSAVDVTSYYLDGSFIWPETWRPTNARRFRVIYNAGYTVDLGDANVWAAPEGIKQAVRLLVGHWYENREAVGVATTSVEIQLGVEALLSQYRRVAI